MFGQLGVEMGADKLVAGAESFGFNKEIDFRQHARITHALGRGPRKESLSWHGQPASRWRHDAPWPRRRQPQATNAEMAMVGHSHVIANDGVIMQPYLVDSVNNANGERSFWPLRRN